MTKPRLENIVKCLILPDVHLDESVPEVYKPVKEYIRQTKPEHIILLGDFMNCGGFSYWDLDKRKTMEGKRFSKEIATAKRELDFLQNYCPKITYFKGNHEERPDNYLEQHPELEGLIEVEAVLNLKERNIDWITRDKQPYRIGELYLMHGVFFGENHAKQTLMAYGCNIVYGHTHRPQSYTMNMQKQSEMMAYGLGCLCDKQPEFMKRPSRWINQFAVLYYNTKNGLYNLYPVNIIKKAFVLDGKLWK